LSLATTPFRKEVFLRRYPCLLIFAFLLLSLGACNNNEAIPTQVAPATVPVTTDNGQPAATPATVEVAPGSPAPPPTLTAVPATPTPSEPLAALVNNRPIFLSAFEQRLARYEQAQAGLGQTPAAQDYRVVVLNDLIERELIAQAAATANITVAPATVDAKLTELKAGVGDAANFQAWLDVNQMTEAEFRDELAAEMLVEQVVAYVTADVPRTAEQVHARYLQVNDAALAQSLLEQVRAGGDFAALALAHSLDRVTGENGGDLGWFTRGKLLVPEVEAAAFALEVNAVSEVITVTGLDGQATYYLVQVIEKDPQRPLTADERSILLQAAFEVWLAEQWSQATIVRYVDTGA
jgi:parvulin-like peptidyl-prolyl isomerase